MSEFGSNEAMRAGLREPFPREMIGSLPRGGVSLDFVGHAAVTDRLNKVAPDWSYRITHVERHEINGLPHVLFIVGEFTVGGVTREEVGDVDRPSHAGQEYQIALGNFIRRGAMRFGVGLDLWSREDLSPVVSSPPSDTAASPTTPTVVGAKARTSKASARPAAASGKAGTAAATSPAVVPAPHAPRDWRPPTTVASKIAVPPESTPSIHFPMWETKNGQRRCIYPGCLIHKAAEQGGAA